MDVVSPGRVGVTLLTVLAPVSWGTTYIVISDFTPPDRPLLAAAWRVVPAGIILILLGRATSPWRPRGREWLHVAALAMCNFGVFFPLLIFAAYRLPGGVAAAGGGLQPLFVAAIAGALAGRRPERATILIGVVAAIGVALVVIRPGAEYDPAGIVAAVCANVAFAFGIVLTKRLPSPGSALTSTGWQLLLAGIVLVPLVAVAEGPPPPLTVQTGAGLGYLSLIGTALAFLLWFSGIRRLPTNAPPLLGLAAPVTGAALGWWLLGQDLTALQLVGFALSIAAIGYAASGRVEPRQRYAALPGPR